ncbi:hypothetical protein OV208_33055 [Corallococcus sp. bb12-1]|uniref:hypothetical protein n=1 Tax=Corallococcus sp. bb12-1 TaxID=2996784 RepID=UPI00226F47DA|nr:hypothetical protein [Corallococcus sp. bb12-1]MCY1046187.1 hypothetical protein [Corallococcus sp. bb12-1]
MFFTDPHEMENPWDTAGHILHKAVHLKPSDLTASPGLGAERAWAQLAPTLEGLVSSGMIEPVSEGRVS